MKLEVSHLYKKYKNRKVLDDVSFKIEKGILGIYGLPNGGKTTLLKILCGLTNQTEGEVLINEIKIEDKKKIRQIVGYLPQEFSAYPHMSVMEMLDYVGIISGIRSSSKRKDVVKRLLSKFELEHFSKINVKVLPKGIRIKLGIAQALIHNPKVILLDEPLRTLKDKEKDEICNLLQQYKEKKIIILSGGNLEEIQPACDYTVELKHGQLKTIREVS